MSFQLSIFSLRAVRLVFLGAAVLNHVGASLGVVDVQDILEPGKQQYLSTEDAGIKGSSGHAPWTHAPNCTHSTSFKSLGTKYCVYTNNRVFMNGISIVSTSKAAESAVEFLDEDPVSYFFRQDQIEKWFTTKPPWKIADIPGKDKGVIATRKIKKYETFMVDQASIVMDLAMEKEVSKKENLRLLRLATDQLRNPGLVRDMSSKHKGEESTENIEEEIMMTNAFGTEVGDVAMRGLFPVVSRINHACNPNAFVMFSQSGLSVGVKAYRDILPGEEISNSYLLLGLTSTRRQQGLERWGFKCTCPLCSAPPSEKAISDTRRQRIEEAKPELVAFWKEGKYQAAIRIGEEIVELIKEEGLTSMLTDEYVVLARLYLIRGDKETAEEYAELAVEILSNLGFLGTEDPAEWGLERLLGAFSDRGVHQMM